MTRKLDVYLHNNYVGTLEQDRYGQMSFRYGSDWLGDTRAMAISAYYRFDANRTRKGNVDISLPVFFRRDLHESPS